MSFDKKDERLRYRSREQKVPSSSPPSDISEFKISKTRTGTLKYDSTAHARGDSLEILKFALHVPNVKNRILRFSENVRKEQRNKMAEASSTDSEQPQ